MSTPNVTRPGGRSHAGRALALLAATVVAAPLLPAPASQASATIDPTTTTAPPPAAAGELTAAGGEPVAVTMITGDTVYWSDTGDGNPRVDVEPAPRDHPVQFEQHGSQQDFYVIPTDVQEQVVAGTVDRELFNVPGLIRQGLDDATTDQLPVIVTFDHDRSGQQLARDADVLPATTNPTVIETINGAGVTVNRGQADRFRQAVLGAPDGDDTTRTAGARGLDGAVQQIMLDQALRIDLAESVPQIGAPQAWEAGYTGEGVTVAVLDTGIDSSHPDLAGQVVAAENFTDEPDATDSHGHGTHVASTIAGTGAASDGARTGVAPGADLLNGKVCRPTPDGQGTCQTSWILAGMEWATAQGADIVNMSLGSDTPSDGSDQLSQLVNQLSADTGTLFVTSAGNSGPRPQTIGAPAAADAALAVGAVNKSGQLARFSSRGPRIGDHAVKPEITAPGVGIIAARAQATSAGSPVDDEYTSLNGTSMASPHVAGAAALLAQAKPDLDRAELKDALVSTAVDGGRLWWEQGTGRVDVPSVLASPIYATGTSNLGHVVDEAAQDITYTNQADHAITLALKVAVTNDSGQAIDVASLSADTLTVPARGRAAVSVTVDLTGIPDRENLIGGGIVTATADGVSLRTGIGFGPIRHALSIKVLDSRGEPVGTPTAPDATVFLDHDTYDPENPVGRLDYSFDTSGGVALGHLPSGVYSLRTVVWEVDPDTGERLRGNVLVAVDVVVDGDGDVTLDARDAVAVDVTVPREVDKRNHHVSLVRERANHSVPGIVTTLRIGGSTERMFVTPAPPSKFGFLALVVHWVLAAPQPVHPLPGPSGNACMWPVNPLPFRCYSEAPAYIYNLPFAYKDGIPRSLHENVTRRDLVEVPTRFHSDQTDDVYIEHQFEAFTSFPCGFGCGGVAGRIWIKPGEVTEYFLADDRFTWVRGSNLHHKLGGAPPATGLFAQISSDWFPSAEAGHKRTEEHWGEGPLRVGAADLREEFLQAPLELLRPGTASRGGDDGTQFVPGYLMMDNTRGHAFGPGDALPAFASWRMWNLNSGHELEGVDFPRDELGRQPLPGVPLFTLSPEEARYRLEQTVRYPEEAGELFRTGPSITTWSFTSRPSDAQPPAGYDCPHPVDSQSPNECQIQPLIQLEYQLDLDIHNRVPAGRAHVFTIRAGHHSKGVDRAPITSLRVTASYDDGQTWRDARFVGRPRDTFDTGGLLPSSAPYEEFMVVLRHPKLGDTSGFVTLRVQAVDGSGGAVDEITHRAYVLK